jgi:hypothetical protein
MPTRPTTQDSMMTLACTVPSLRRLGCALTLVALFGTGACAAEEAGVAIPKDKNAFHIFVLMGQSNMAGTSTPIPVDYVQPSDEVYDLRKDLVWRKAATPLDPAHGQGFSLGESFARHYALLHPGIKVGVIQCARGGRGIKELAKGGKDRDGSPNYDDSLAKIRAAMQRGTLKAVLWHQGETDAGDAGYVAKLGALAADLRQDLKSPDLPFIAGELGRYASWTASFNSRIPAAADVIPHCAVASSEGLLDLGDHVHFSGYGSEVLGARYLKAYLSMAEPALLGKFEPQLAELTTAMAAREAAWTSVLNGDMSEGVSRPFAWDSRWTGKGNLEISRDTVNPASAPAALKLASIGGPAQGSVGQTLRNVSGKKLHISAKVRATGFSQVQILVRAIDKNYKQMLQTTVASTGPSETWKELSADIAIPAEAMSTQLSFGVDGNGAAWIDDVVVERLDATPEPAATPAATPAGNDLAKNGSLTEGGDTAANWTSVWTKSGKLKPQRDTAVFKSAPAALRVDSDGGPVTGNASQQLEGAAGKKLRITGWAKSDGKNGLAVALGSFADGWKITKFEFAFHTELGAAQEWTHFDTTLEVPADAVHVVLSAGIDGEGSAWYDDISAVVVP